MTSRKVRVRAARASATMVAVVVGGLVAVAPVVGTGARAWAADAGWVLEARNWEKGKDLLPEPVLRRVERGEYWFPVTPVDPERFRRNYSTTFWQASEANAGKYDLDPETCGLRDKATGQIPDFLFGFPFMEIDPDDQGAGCKIAWNFLSAGLMGGGAGASFYLNGVEAEGEYRTIRTRVSAMPLIGYHGDRIPNPDRLAVKAMTKALEPADVEGVSTLVVRHWDWAKPDDMWAYVPSTRRARRIHASARSEPVAGMDIFADDINCYAGKVEEYRWKLVGEGQVLAPILGDAYGVRAQRSTPTRWLAHTPAVRANYELTNGDRKKGAAWLLVENVTFAPRPVWIVEGESRDPYYNFGKVIMYFDKDMYRIYWKLVHDKAGEYFYNAMCGYTFVVSSDRAYSAVAPTVVVGVNDKENRAAIGGRSHDQFIEQAFDPEQFSLKALRARPK